MNPITRRLEAIAGKIAANRAAFTPEQEAEARAWLKDWNDHVDAIRASDPPGIDLPTCFECCNFECGGLEASFCKVAEQPDIKRFRSSPESKRNPDMSRCPGFKEDR